MKQSINLINTLPNVKKIYLPCLEIRKYVVSFFVLMVIYSGYVYWKDNNMGKELDALKQKQSLKVKELANLSKQLPASLRASDKELNKIETEIEHNQKLVAVFNNKKHLSESGFSDLLKGLAQNISPNVWLTEFDISQNGSKIELYGKSNTSQGVFKFLNHLDDSPTFKHVQFKIEELESIKNESGDVTHEFTMETVNA